VRLYVERLYVVPRYVERQDVVRLYVERLYVVHERLYVVRQDVVRLYVGQLDCVHLEHVEHVL
jgi:hypothetical protein